MATRQTVTLTKADGTYADYDEAVAGVRALVDESVTTALNNSRTAAEFTNTVDFDVDTQVLTFVRTWDEDAFNTHKAAIASVADAGKTALESAGWTVTEASETV